MIEKPDPLIDQLLHASRLCGLTPRKDPVHRRQLFFVANKDLKSPSHEMDFQRAIETGVDKYHLWANHILKGSGEYLITETGYAEADRKFGIARAVYVPCNNAACHFRISGRVADIELELRYVMAELEVYLGSELVSAVEARKLLLASHGLPSRARSSLASDRESATALYDMAIDLSLKMKWGKD